MADGQSVSWRLVAAALVGGAITAAAMLTTQRIGKQRRISKMKKEAAESMKGLSFSPVETTPPTVTTMPEDLIREQLSRNYAFLGEEKVEKVRKSFVIVVGVGGVGSHAAHMLLRSGVEHLRLIDFDQVTLSSLNRHAVATHADVGTSKVGCLASHFKEIAPHARVEVCVELFDINSASRLLDGNPDFVLDCIDNLNTKIDLIKYCHDHKIRILASMGAGAKADPSRIQIADISDTFEDPLARSTRKGLRLKGVEGGIPVVYSTEKPGSVKLLPMSEEKVDEADQYATLPNFRSRILPVLGTLPALFGCAMASYVITELAGFEMEPLPIKLRNRTYEKILRDIKMQKKQEDEIKLSVRDVGFIFEEIWRGKSLISGSLDKEKVTLTRWDASLPYQPGNMVCMTRKEADEHALLSPTEYASHYGPKIMGLLEKRFKEEQEAEQWR